MAYLKTYNISLSKDFDGILGNHQKKDWKIYVTSENKSMVSPEAFDLLDKMLVYDHVQTPSQSSDLSLKFIEWFLSN